MTALHTAKDVVLNAIVMIALMWKTMKKEKPLLMPLLIGILMLSNQRLNKLKASILKAVIVKNQDALKNIVNATKAEYLALIYVFVKDAKIVMVKSLIVYRANQQHKTIVKRWILIPRPMMLTP